MCLQTFKNPKPALLEKLRDTGPVPGDENGLKKRAALDDGGKKKKRLDKNVRHLSHPDIAKEEMLLSEYC